MRVKTMRDKAELCERMADTTHEPSEKQAWLDAGSTWSRAADAQARVRELTAEAEAAEATAKGEEWVPVRVERRAASREG